MWKWKLVTQSCPTLCDPMDCIAQQAPLSMEFSRQEYWSGLPFSFSRGSSWPRDQTQVSRIAGRLFIIWAIYMYRLNKILTYLIKVSQHIQKNNKQQIQKKYLGEGSAD